MHHHDNTENMWARDLLVGVRQQIFLTEGFPDGSVVKNLPTEEETQFLSLGQEYSLEKEMSTHSSILAWEIPWTEEPGGLQSMGLQKSWTQLMIKQ